MAGRACPLSYRLGARTLRDALVVRVPTTLYAIGGLYGNRHALRAIRARAAREPAAPTLIFNGDFNFFDTEPAWWRALNESVRSAPNHVAMAGNVEVESSASAVASDAGCGCGCARRRASTRRPHFFKALN